MTSTIPAPAAPAATEAPKTAATPAAPTPPKAAEAPKTPSPEAKKAEPVKAEAPKAETKTDDAKKPLQLGDIDPAEAKGEVDLGDGEKLADEKDGEPVTYDFGQAPEGVTYREPVLDVYKQALAKHKIAPEVAKDLLDTVLPAMQKDADEQLKAHFDARNQQWDNEWRQQHGDKADEVLKLASRAFVRLFDADTQEKIRGSDLARAPWFRNALAALGSRITNDRSVKGTTASVAQPADPVSRLAAQYEKEDRERASQKAR